MVVHGIPDDRALEEGDIISIDCGAIVDGYHGDAAFTAGVGDVDAEAQRLIDVTRAALDAGIAELVPGSRLGDIGARRADRRRAGGFSRGPRVRRPRHRHRHARAARRAQLRQAGAGQAVEAGDVFAVEPMVCARGNATAVLDDGWTVVTVDGARAAHWEHTVAVTDDGPEILTLP